MFHCIPLQKKMYSLICNSSFKLDFHTLQISRTFWSCYTTTVYSFF